MRPRLFVLCAALALLLAASGLPAAAPPALDGLEDPQSPILFTAPIAPDRAAVARALRTSPIMFIENVGQFPEGAQFQVWSRLAFLCRLNG